MPIEKYSWTLDDSKSLFEIIAFISAAGFFIWKLFTGWLIINLKISIDVERQAKGEDGKSDLITFKVNLSKGSIDTLWLKDVSVRITPSGLQSFYISFPELYKLRIKNNQFDWDNPYPNSRLTMAPDESFHFGRSISVPSDFPVLIELAVLGERAFWKWFQWKCSVSSPPLKKI